MKQLIINSIILLLFTISLPTHTSVNSTKSINNTETSIENKLQELEENVYRTYENMRYTKNHSHNTNTEFMSEKFFETALLKYLMKCTEYNIQPRIPEFFYKKN